MYFKKIKGLPCGADDPLERSYSLRLTGWEMGPHVYGPLHTSWQVDKNNSLCKICRSTAPGWQQRGGLANEAFAGPVGLVIICENYIGSYCWDMQLTCKTCNLNIFAGPQVCMAFKVFADTEDRWHTWQSMIEALAYRLTLYSGTNDK